MKGTGSTNESGKMERKKNNHGRNHQQTFHHIHPMHEREKQKYEMHEIIRHYWQTLGIDWNAPFLTTCMYLLHGSKKEWKRRERSIPVLPGIGLSLSLTADTRTRAPLSWIDFPRLSHVVMWHVPYATWPRAIEYVTVSAISPFKVSRYHSNHR